MKQFLKAQLKLHATKKNVQTYRNLCAEETELELRRKMKKK